MRNRQQREAERTRADRASDRLDTCIDELADAGFASTRERTRNRCVAFMEYCRANHNLQDGDVPDPSWLVPYAKTFWAKLESEKTVVEKVALVVALCRRLAGDADPSVAAKWEKVDAKSVVSKLPARFSNRR